MILLKAAVQSVSGLAVRWNVRFGKHGGLMRLRIDGITVCHGSSAANSTRGATPTTAVLSTRSLMNSRRVIMFLRIFHAKAQSLRKGTKKTLDRGSALCLV